MHRTIISILALSALLVACDSGEEEAEDPAPEAETAEEPTEPEPEPEPEPHATLSVGGESACVALADGGARCWGRNGSGQLGNGTTDTVDAPVAVQGLTDVTQIGFEGGRSCALIADGTVHCWGGNPQGQLGDGSAESHSAPVAVQGIDNATQISVGHGHACARLADGTARCWGLGMHQRLGNGATDNQNTPVEVQGLSDIEEIRAGYGHTCARLADGTARCWGSNSDGQCGTGESGMDVAEPTAVSGLSDVVQLAVGAQNTCARLADGALRCWGDNTYGQIGDGTTDDRATPTAVSGIANATDVTIGGGYGGAYACAALDDGSAKCWGNGRDGTLGDGNGEAHNATSPVAVQGLSGVLDIDAGGNNLNSHACAVTEGDVVQCWGYAYYIGVPTALEPRLSPTAISM